MPSPIIIQSVVPYSQQPIESEADLQRILVQEEYFYKDYPYREEWTPLVFAEQDHSISIVTRQIQEEHQYPIYPHQQQWTPIVFLDTDERSVLAPLVGTPDEEYIQPLNYREEWNPNAVVIDEDPGIQLVVIQINVEGEEGVIPQPYYVPWSYKVFTDDEARGLPVPPGHPTDEWHILELLNRYTAWPFHYEIFNNQGDSWYQIPPVCATSSLVDGWVFSPGLQNGNVYSTGMQSGQVGRRTS